jgi:uncharacterized OB-fold protein
VNDSHYEAFLASANEYRGYPMQRCVSCGWITNFPRVCCPQCLGDVEWFGGSGTGVIRSLAIIRRTHSGRYDEYVPIVFTHVELTEGPEVIATIVGTDRLKAAIGMRVSRAREGTWSALPQFHLAG